MPEFLLIVILGAVVLLFKNEIMQFVGGAFNKHADKEPEDVPITPEQVELLKETWQMVFPMKEQVAELFYGKLFELDPETRPLFKADMKSQGDSLMSTLNRIVSLIDKLDQVLPILQDLGRRHVEYGVKPEHYDTVAQALLWTLEQGLGEEFTDEVREAWTKAYVTMAHVMIEAAQKV